MSSSVHPTAIVSDKAQVSSGVSIGAYSIIGPHVVLKENVTIHSHVVIEGHTTVGKGTQIYPYAVIGMAPQSRGYKGEPSRVEIGENCLIREQVTIHLGTAEGHMVTKIGDGSMLMIGVHVGHDCDVGKHVVLTNHATLGGHVTVGDYANIGGLAAIHQFTRIGAYAMIAGTAAINEDVIPFGAVMAVKGKLSGVNIIGMQRRSFEREEIHDIRNAYKLLVRNPNETLEDRLVKIRTLYGHSRAVKELLDFIEANPKRHLCLPVEDWEVRQDAFS